MTRRKLRPARAARRFPSYPPLSTPAAALPSAPSAAGPRSRLLGTASHQAAAIPAEVPADLPPPPSGPAPATPAVTAGTLARWNSGTMTTEAPPRPDKADVAILIVDDDPRNLFAVRETLEELGAQLVLARSGEEALKQLLRQDFALILLDVHMPGMDGYETAEMIRMREKSRHIPIIFLTAINKDETHIFRGYATGAVDYMFKPVDPHILKCKVQVFVDLYRKTEEVKREVEAKQRLLDENERVRREMRHAEQALRRAEERQALILAQLPIVLYTADLTPGMPFRYVSDTAQSVLGCPACAFTDDPHRWEAGIHPEDRDRVLRQLDSLHQTGLTTVEYRWVCPDGSERHLLDQAVVVRDENGVPCDLFGTILDVTETRQAQRQLAHIQKMEMIGQLTGGIAHDFNNMLMVVIGSLERLVPALAEDPKSGRRAEMALQAALRCSDMTRRLLTFARRQQLHPEPVDLAALAAGMGELMERTLGGAVTISIEPAAGDEPLWLAAVDRSQAESALLNLVINARDAMSGGGTLRIRTGNIRFDAPRSAHGMSVEAGDYILLQVADSGCGMAPDVLERAFEPFFTTKETGKGTGLGLAMIHGFVKQSGGLISIDSQPGAGTTFRLYLPRMAVEGARSAAEDAGDDEAVAGRGEMVLVVDDDADVRSVAVQAVAALGYQVLEADGAAAALALLDRRSVDLLFTDIVMPGGMNGRELAMEALRRHPSLKLLFASGYANGTSAPEVEAGASAGERETDPATVLAQAEMLAKPYRDGDLARALRRALDLQAPPMPAEAARD
ncbi:response regulator [Azospirillum picis]|uniref:histidine kinase n=1 Tax=Azospirillum picis TaxID=488438 RepID=A0ABU0MMJ7_9PROT|nr:response regulator [Azospirillum picis]MBP2300942.1 signal transduction histidine kinase/response regulator RpfG family c-di-GMP phosphodiesterase [Azospirillum picis]MDQ0534438.1 signal transduction histidine kinase/response regulator RpfG family c-di-GMP phosphodiesterase [Azospirillum picis]